MWVGPLLLYLAASAYGLLAVHGSTDVWIGLAAGRQILAAEEFPSRDTFSYTAYGEPWYNQNWLTHVAQYWLYTRVGADAVVYATWITSAALFAAVLLAAYWRSGTWLGAVLAAALVALGCRDYLSPRPATAGFLCIASLSALLCALEGQRDRRRWWPIVLLLPLLLIWGNAHGSFVFGYGVLGLYVGHWFVARTIRVRYSWSFSLALVLILLVVAGLGYSATEQDASRPPGGAVAVAGAAFDMNSVALLAVILVAYLGYWIAVRQLRPMPAISGWQAAGIVGVVAAAFVLTVALGPFGLDNFVHGEKVAGSQVFRQVTEWRPAYKLTGDFPPVWRFWAILVFGLGLLLISGLTALALGKKTGREQTHRGPQASLFDIAVVVIGLAMTLWARRFAPICLIFAAPVLLTWIVRWLGSLPLAARPSLRRSLMAAAGLFGVAVGYKTASTAYGELVTQFEDYPQYNLLERVVRYDLTPHNAILFLKNNNLHVNLLVEWSQGGVVMLHAPNAKVFMDGRAQQVYDETHYAQYNLLLVSPDTPRPLMMRILDHHKTDAVLLRRWERPRNLGIALDESPDWVPALLDSDYTLFLRRGSRGLAELGERLRRGAEWRPDTPAALAARGLVWEAISPPDLERALTCWRAAVRQNVTAGKLCFPRITSVLLELGRSDEAERLIDEYHRLLNQPFTGLPDRVRRDLLNTLATCRRILDAASRTEQATDADG